MMKTKKFDAIKMVRTIRDKSSTEYYTDKKEWLRKLADFQASKADTKNRLFDHRL